MQVVTSENFATLVETGKVPEFKAPEAKTEPVVEKTEAEKVAFTTKDGKAVEFEKKPEASEVTTDKAAVTADEDDEDKDLPERVRKQIGKKHRLMKEAEEFGKESYLARLAAEKRAEAAEQRLKQLESGVTKSKGEGEPDPKDFKDKTNAEYIDAMVKYKFEQMKQQERQQQIDKAQEKAQAEFIDRLNAARKELPDFDEVTGDAEYDVVPHVASYIAESPLGPKLGYHFAKNPDELDRIQKLSPIRAIAELGKLETKLETKVEAKEEKPAPVISKAPSPIQTVDTSSKTVVQKDPSKMSLQELRTYEQQRAAEKRR